jgi:TolB-like protein/DNA-binding CsgD family transcriptional regulator/Flp pilus assembly protein TadD
MGEEPTPRSLTPRQLEVLELMAKGLTNREIAGVLGISAGTVKIHVSAVIDALEVTNRTEAAMVLQDFRIEEEPDGPKGVPGFGGRPAIAVLPFDAMTPGPEQEHFADGLVEDLTTRLAAWRWFPVIARNSAFVYKGQHVDAVRVGRELGARYLVEGSARRAGDRVRINVQLIDGRTGAHVFAEMFDREMDDVFAVQDEVVEAILGALTPALLRFEALQARRRPAASLTSWDRLVRGFAHLAAQSEAEIAEAARVLDSLCEDDPGLALAHSARAGVAVFDALLQLGSPQLGRGSAQENQRAQLAGLRAIQRAETSARQALALDDQEASAHTALGLSLLLQGRADEARRALESALELNPSYATACLALGAAHLREGDAAQAGPLLERGLRLSPRDPLAHHFLGALCATRMLEGDLEAALAAGRRSVELEPPGAISYRPALVAVLAHLGREEEARRLLEEVLAAAPEFSLEVSRLLAPPALLDLVREGFRRLGVELA